MYIEQEKKYLKYWKNIKENDFKTGKAIFCLKKKKQGTWNITFLIDIWV